MFTVPLLSASNSVNSTYRHTRFMPPMPLMTRMPPMPSHSKQTTKLTQLTCLNVQVSQSLGRNRQIPPQAVFESLPKWCIEVSRLTLKAVNAQPSRGLFTRGAAFRTPRLSLLLNPISNPFVWHCPKERSQFGAAFSGKSATLLGVSL